MKQRDHMRLEYLHEYNKWLMEVWNPKQLYIPFAIDAPRAFLEYKEKKSQIVWSTKIRESDFSIRLKNILLAMGLETFADIHAYYHKDNKGVRNFLIVRNFGMKSVKELKSSGLLY